MLMNSVKLLIGKLIMDYHSNMGFIRRYHTIEPRRGAKIHSTRGLCIKPSSIAKASCGVFTRRCFMKGDVICGYEGDVYHIFHYLLIKDLSHLAKIDNLHMLLPYVNDYGSKINHHFDRSQVNVYFLRNGIAKSITIVALRNINKNEELFTYYDDAHLYLQAWSREIIERGVSS